MKRLVVLVVLTCSGCVSAGREVIGTFTVDGVPRAGVLVYFPTNLDDFSDCGNARPAATTNAAGQFMTHVRSFPVRPCFHVDGKTYSTFFTVDNGAREPIRLTCELPLVTTGHPEDGHICR
jgi:hypothetical protein